MRISIVLAVYNGEKYLKDQIESLINQTRKADEVIIMNDNSTDNTVPILEKYIRDNKLDSWNIVNNPINYGWRKNFIEGLKKCTGDYIFLCDQDDIWHKDKVEKMTKVLNENKEILLLCSNYSFLFENGLKPVKNKYTVSDKTVEKYMFDERFLYVERPGCVYAMRRKLAEMVIDNWYERSAHDALAWRIANLFDGLYIYNDATIEFRRHTGSATAKKNNKCADKISDCLFWKETVEHLENISDRYDINDRDKKKKILEKTIKFADSRRRMYETRSILKWLGNVKYMKYYYSFKVFLGDLYYILKGQ